jgi:dihydroxyacetone kinase-like predicted kinase
MKLLLTEILQKVNNAKTKAEKKKILQQHNSQALRSLFIWNFDESVTSAIPDGEVPYRPNDQPKGLQHDYLEQNQRKFAYFVKGGITVSNMKREEIFIGLLETLHADEAELLCLVKDKSLQKKYTRISATLVKEAFPEITWGGRG